jgi:hypothetical protein
VYVSPCVRAIARACKYVLRETNTKYSSAAQRTARSVITRFYSYESFELLCLPLEKQFGKAQGNKCWHVLALKAEYSLVTSLKVSS